MPKHVMSVGFDIPGEVCESVSFESDTSLLDADIIVFSPNLEEYMVGSQYRGRNCIAKEDSGRLQLSSAHWRRELEIALEAGKTVFVVMLGTEILYVHTGQRTYSGTGRNARATDHVDLFDPYSSIPVPGLATNVQRRTGERLKTTKDIGSLAAYWQEFGEASYYQVYLEQQIGVPALVTQTGDKMVGGIIRFEDRKGAVILLPFPNLSYIVEQRTEQPSGEENTSEAERGVGHQFINALIEIDKILKNQAERTPSPTWTNAEEYALREEIGFRTRVTDFEAKIVELQQLKLEAENNLDAAGNIRGLVFETGKPLESAILEALRTIGFAAEGFVDEESEFDSVFTDPSGVRLLGEAEGKNDKAINIDKLSQLERNIQEDFEKRTDSTDYAKGVLFGNAFRLTQPAERGDYFTPKCVAGAKRLGVALVRTPDLFTVAKFLKENPDPQFAALCRKTIREASGTIVQFPPIPKQ